MSQVSVEYELDRDDQRFSSYTVVDRPPSLMHDLAEWVHDHCGGRVILGQSLLYFEMAAEATYFQLAYREPDE